MCPLRWRALASGDGQRTSFIAMWIGLVMIPDRAAAVVFTLAQSGVSVGKFENDLLRLATREFDLLDCERRACDF